MLDWLPGYERVDITGCTGPNVPQVGNWSVTLHSMEGSIETAINNVFRPKPCYCPHFSIAPKKKRKVQHVPMPWPSAALNNAPGGVETNRAREIQIEIEGFAKESQDWSDDELAFIGQVLADIVNGGAPINLDHHPKFVGVEAGFIARVDAPQRMTYDTWLAFDGVCGHQHVPENEHWDPGHLDIDKVIRFAKSKLGQPQEDDDMPEYGQWKKEDKAALADDVAHRVATLLAEPAGDADAARIELAKANLYVLAGIGEDESAPWWNGKLSEHLNRFHERIGIGSWFWVSGVARAQGAVKDKLAKFPWMKTAATISEPDGPAV